MKISAIAYEAMDMCDFLSRDIYDDHNDHCFFLSGFVLLSANRQQTFLSQHHTKSIFSAVNSGAPLRMAMIPPSPKPLSAPFSLK